MAQWATAVRNIVQRKWLALLANAQPVHLPPLAKMLEDAFGPIRLALRRENYQPDDSQLAVVLVREGTDEQKSEVTALLDRSRERHQIVLLSDSTESSVPDDHVVEAPNGLIPAHVSKTLDVFRRLPGFSWSEPMESDPDDCKPGRSPTRLRSLLSEQGWQCGSLIAMADGYESVLDSVRRQARILMAECQQPYWHLVMIRSPDDGLKLRLALAKVKAELLSSLSKDCTADLHAAVADSIRTIAVVPEGATGDVPGWPRLTARLYSWDEILPWLLESSSQGRITAEKVLEADCEAEAFEIDVLGPLNPEDRRRGACGKGTQPIVRAAISELVGPESARLREFLRPAIEGRSEYTTDVVAVFVDHWPNEALPRYEHPVLGLIAHSREIDGRGYPEELLEASARLGWTDVILACPDNSRSKVDRLLKCGAPRAALEVLDLLDAKERDGSTLLLRARALMQLGQYDQVDALLPRLRLRGPMSHQLQVIEIQCNLCTAMNRLPEAIKLRRGALDLARKVSTGASARLSNEEHELGLLLLRSGRVADAAEAFNNALRLLDSARFPLRYAASLLQLANCELRNYVNRRSSTNQSVQTPGELENAESLLHEAENLVSFTEVHPISVALKYTRARLAYRSERLMEAYEILNKLLKPEASARLLVPQITKLRSTVHVELVKTGAMPAES